MTLTINLCSTKNCEVDEDVIFVLISFLIKLMTHNEWFQWKNTIPPETWDFYSSCQKVSFFMVRRGESNRRRLHKNKSKAILKLPWQPSTYCAFIPDVHSVSRLAVFTQVTAWFVDTSLITLASVQSLLTFIDVCKGRNDTYNIKLVLVPILTLSINVSHAEMKVLQWCWFYFAQMKSFLYKFWRTIILPDL